MSAYFKNRSELLKSNGTPKLSNAKENLGDIMAKVLFDQCEEALREDFGLKVPLKGPGDVLWVSPSDLLIGKIALKPPFTPKCLQALTHKGILEIGQDLENTFKQEMELDKQKALEKYKTELLASVEDRMKSEIKDVEIRERLACHIEMERQQQEFELLLKSELEKLEIRVREQYEDLIANHETYLKAKWEEKLQREIKKTVDLMTKDYLAQLEEQQNRLTQIFKLELKKQEVLREYDAKLNKHKAMEALRQLKHNLECTNLVNMMYVLCMERRKCCEQKEDIEKRYKNEIKQLEERIRQKDQRLLKVTAEKDKEIFEVSIRESCLTEVLKHFQKFINFALRAAPTQAEFLLSVEKMMVFELTSEVANTEIPKRPECPMYASWIHEGTSVIPSAQVSNLEIQDHHNCFNELNPPLKVTGAELDENDFLPAMHFKNKTYIREDFRDMLSGGVPLSPSNDLWNKDVEILVNEWRDQTGEEPKKTETNDRDSIDAEAYSNKFYLDSASHERRRSNKSTVQFSSGNSPPDSRSERLSTDSKKLYRKSSVKPGTLPLVEDILFAPTNTEKSIPVILAAKDSFDILIEKKQKSMASLGTCELPFRQKEDTIKEETETQCVVEEGLILAGNELVVETKDSVVMRMSEMAKSGQSSEFLVSPRDSMEIAKHLLEDKMSETRSRTSKLSLAKNSVELLRESIYKLKVPSVVCQKKDYKRHESKDKGLQHKTAFGGTCCDKCKRKEDGLESAPSDATRDGVVSKAESLGDGDERSVRISRIQIINLDDYASVPSVVSFNKKPVFLKEQSSSKRVVDSKAKSNRATSTRTHKRKMTKQRKDPVYKCKVLGDLEAKEGDQSNDEFTAERIHSLIRLMRDQPYLLQLFTSGSR